MERPKSCNKGSFLVTGLDAVITEEVVMDAQAICRTLAVPTGYLAYNVSPQVVIFVPGTAKLSYELDGVCGGQL